MLSDKSAAKIDHGLASLALAQLTGNAPPPGQVTLAELAKRCSVSEATILKLERMALAKLRAALTSDAAHLLPPRYRKP